MKTSKEIKIKKALIYRVVSASSRLEGLSFSRAKKNTAVINKLKKYGRGFLL